VLFIECSGCCGMAVKRMRMLGVSVRKIKAHTENGDSDTD